ncbi:hypothetical protein ACFPYJ_18740 [Paenibacillus solisilvae]|uniref:Uncharacterized protein n=1 Tax=Paenibacillus solisilvae TaxID=2486751 RepID=A0ABW0W104_9BACL
MKTKLLLTLVPSRTGKSWLTIFALGSSSVITAAGLAGLGLNVQFISIVGDDEFGRFSLIELSRFGVTGIDTRG